MTCCLPPIPLDGCVAYLLALRPMRCSPQFAGDLLDNFGPTFVLLNQSGTFVPTGPEMDSVRRNKRMFGTKVDEMQFTGPSNSCTPSNSGPTSDAKRSSEMKSTLLVDMSNSVFLPYDMTLMDLDASNYPGKVPVADGSGTR
ncbi:unnamed protein product [Lupinus luteus]|uniref:Uncharacterized protein n=1 Tax=Lupinus luteus TaxID=3873 RepID=A0AAV1VT26_LUPLU